MGSLAGRRIRVDGRARIGYNQGGMRRRLDERERSRPPLAPEAIRAAVAAQFAGDGRVTAVALFGSYVRDRVRGRSDVDLGVLLARGAAPPSLLDLRGEWEEALSRRLGGYPVDVVLLPQASLLLRHAISREGRVLLEREEGAWQMFRRRTRGEWRDRAHVRERYWRRFLQRWEEIGFGERERSHPAAPDTM
ncbi:MAG: nucleotidyltransferase domain-containing protein [Armatimonadetes bacterium]|nr:nucleotidyltransferase domain-containing protein [Armatimonadota bacterium]